MRNRATTPLRTVKPVGLLLACIASLCAVVPVQAAGALDPFCMAEPHTPGMIDPKLYMLDASSKAVCQGPVTLLRAEAKLSQWFNRTSAWEDVSYGDSSQKDVQYVWADAYMSCKNMGLEVAFRTLGYATGVQPPAWNTQDGWRSSNYRVFNCGESALEKITP